MRLNNLAIIFLAFLCISGCASSVDRDRLVSQVEALESYSATLRDTVDALHAEVERSGSERAQELLADAQAALATVETELPIVRESLASLEADGEGKVSVWALGGLAALRYGPKLLSLIPGLGGILGPIAAILANASWAMTSTKRQKRDEAVTITKAHLLDYQSNLHAKGASNA